MLISSHPHASRLKRQLKLIETGAGLETDNVCFFGNTVFKRENESFWNVKKFNVLNIFFNQTKNKQNLKPIIFLPPASQRHMINKLIYSRLRGCETGKFSGSSTRPWVVENNTISICLLGVELSKWVVCRVVWGTGTFVLAVEQRIFGWEHVSGVCVFGNWKRLVCGLCI